MCMNALIYVGTHSQLTIQTDIQIHTESCYVTAVLTLSPLALLMALSGRRTLKTRSIFTTEIAEDLQKTEKHTGFSYTLSRNFFKLCHYQSKEQCQYITANIHNTFIQWYNFNNLFKQCPVDIARLCRPSYHLSSGQHRSNRAPFVQG